MELYGKVSANLCFKKNQTISKTYHVRPKLKFLVDGPFPSPLESIFRHKITVWVAGGVGITPFISVLNELLLDSSRKEPSRIHLTWVVNHMDQILWFSEIFEQLMEKVCRICFESWALLGGPGIILFCTQLQRYNHPQCQ